MADPKSKSSPPNGYAFPKTLSQSIYNYLKDSIINNKLKSNQRIHEKEIAGLFGVSTTPVREAVLRLGAEGFVNISSHRESIVKEVSYQELKEILQILATLDSLGTPIAVDNLDQEALDELEELTKQLEGSCHVNSIEKFIAVNQKIHKKIWKYIPSKKLQENIYNVNDQLLRYNYARIYAFRKPGVLEKSLAEHREILKTLKNKDKKKLKALMSKHWGSFLRPSPLKEGLKEYLSNEKKEVKIEERKKQKRNVRRSIRKT